MDYSSGRNYRCRILEFTHKNNRVISMENELIKLTLLPDKGADVYEIIHKATDTDFMWKAPGGLRDVSKHIPSSAQALGAHPDYYEGGWHECFPGGGPFKYKGIEMGLHGEVTLLPWSFSVLEDSADSLRVSFSCETIRTPYRLTKTVGLKRNSPVVEFEETIENESGERLQYMWGHHPVFGKPFLDGDCRIDIPAGDFEVCRGFNEETSLFEQGHAGRWPHATDRGGAPVDLSLVPSGEKPTADLFFLKGLREGWYAVTHTKKRIGIGFSWDAAQFPYVWYWQVAYGLGGFPWYGRTYNIGLEFWTSIPNSFDQAVAAGTIGHFEPHETKRTEYSVVVYAGLEKVERIGRDGAVE